MVEVGAVKPPKFGSTDFILEQLGLGVSCGKPLVLHAEATGAEGPLSKDPSSGTGIVACPNAYVLALPVGKRGVELSRQECKLLEASISEVRGFASTGRTIKVSSRYGTLRTTIIRGIRVLECSAGEFARPLRMTRGKAALLLAFETEIRKFARRGH